MWVSKLIDKRKDEHDETEPWSLSSLYNLFFVIYVCLQAVYALLTLGKGIV